MGGSVGRLGLNAPGDMERSPFNIRQYPVLCSFRPVAFASTLTDVLAAQPDFATTLPAPTLARITLTMMEEYPTAFVRLARRRQSRTGKLGEQKNRQNGLEIFAVFEARLRSYIEKYRSEDAT